METDRFEQDLVAILAHLETLRAAWQPRPNGGIYFTLTDHCKLFKDLHAKFKVDQCCQQLYSALLDVNLHALGKCCTTPMGCSAEQLKQVKMAIRECVPMIASLRHALFGYLHNDISGTDSEPLF